MLMKGKKQQKFHETLVGMLYPLEEMPVPDQVELNLVATITEGLEKDLDEDVDTETSNSSSDMDGTVAQKLTRAQRKRLKRKKLKESASCRRQIIGPLLPSSTYENTEDGPCILVEDEPSPMDSTYGLTHAFETSPNIGRPDEPEACTLQNKVKRRRIAKRASGNTVRLMAPV